MIPDEAVYAAAFAVYGSGFDGSPQKDAWLRDFRKALEAAAPHMRHVTVMEGPYPGSFSAGWSGRNSYDIIATGTHDEMMKVAYEANYGSKA